jgi:hypothetical protein
MTTETRILGILVKNRQQNILKVQDTLTKFGCSISTRLGINASRDYHVEDAGLILLELTYPHCQIGQRHDLDILFLWGILGNYSFKF